MSNKKGSMNDNPLLKVYLKILPALAAAVVVIVVLVKLITGIFAPEQIILEVKYDDYEDGALIQSMVRVAEDEAFTKELDPVVEKKSGFMNTFDFFTVEEESGLSTENGTYTFTYETEKIPSVLYVKSPEWWYPVDTDGSIVLPAEVGAATEAVTEAGGFTITNIETVKISSGIFNVNVTMSATMDAVPSDIRLIMDGYKFEEWDGSTDVTFDEATGFAERTVVFRFNRGSHEDISELLADAQIVVEEYTVRKKYTAGTISSNVDGMTILVCD